MVNEWPLYNGYLIMVVNGLIHGHCWSYYWILHEELTVTDVTGHGVILILQYNWSSSDGILCTIQESNVDSSNQLLRWEKLKRAQKCWENKRRHEKKISRNKKPRATNVKKRDEKRKICQMMEMSRDCFLQRQSCATSYRHIPSFAVAFIFKMSAPGFPSLLLV